MVNDMLDLLTFALHMELLPQYHRCSTNLSKLRGELHQLHLVEIKQ